MATGNKKQVAEVMVIACSRFFCWFCKRKKFGCSQRKQTWDKKWLEK